MPNAARYGASGSTWAPLRAAAAVVLALLVAVLVLRHALAGSVAGSPFAARNSIANAKAAKRAIAAGDPAAARRLASLALARTSRTPGALSALAIAEQSLGDLDRAALLMGDAGALGWRDGVAQLWLASAAFAAGDETAAAGHMSAAILDDAKSDAMFSAMERLASDPRFRAAMAQRIAMMPSWRATWLLDERPLAPERIDGRLALVSALARTPGPPGPAELHAFLWQLVRSRRFADAFAVWRDAGGETVPGFEGALADPDAALPFGWTPMPMAGAAAMASRSAEGVALTAHSDGSSVGAIARRMVLLAPGVHAFTVTAHESAPGALQAFRWMAICLPGGVPLSSSAEPPRPVAGGAVRVRTLIAVPRGCGAEYLQLHAQMSDAAPNPSVTFSDPQLE